MDEIPTVTTISRARSRPIRILHFSLAASFDGKFLFHPLLNDAAQDVHHFAVGQSGYRYDYATLNGRFREYLRALKLLARGVGSVNRNTTAYCHTTKFALPGLLLCRLFGIGQVIYFNHGVPYVGHKGVMRWALWLLEKANVTVAHRFITVSPAMVGLLSPSSAATPWLHSTKPGSSSGLRESNFSPLSLVRQRARKGDKQGTRFLYAGRLQARKGVFVLLEAWRTHAARFPQDELWLCGFEADEMATHGTYTDLPRIKVHGYVTDMSRIYQEIDVVVSPSFHEGFGYTLLEGAARGCCIVSSEVPGPDVMFTNWMRQQLFKAGDPSDLARVMSRLSGSQAALATGRYLSYRSARRFAMQKLSYPHIETEQ